MIASVASSTTVSGFFFLKKASRFLISLPPRLSSNMPPSNDQIDCVLEMTFFISTTQSSQVRVSFICFKITYLISYYFFTFTPFYFGKMSE